MPYDLIFFSSELFYHQIKHQNEKKLHQKNAENSSPPPRFRKSSKLFLQITIGEMKKAPQAKIFVIGTIFTPKIAQKCKKWPTENSPPVGGTENVFISLYV